MKVVRYLLILAAAFALAAAPQGAAPKKTPAKTEQKAAKSAAKAPKSALVDINSATEQQLKELPGIGDAYSTKIIAGRPYRSKNQLLQKKIIPQATYDKIKDQIVARQGGKK